MKLTEIAIEGPNHLHSLRLGRFAEGLNFVYGENASGKSLLRNFIRDHLLGERISDRSQTEYRPGNNSSIRELRGHLLVKDGNSEFRLDRDSVSNAILQLTPLAGTTLAPNYSLPQLVGDVNLDLYDSIYNFSFYQTRTNALQLNRALYSQLGVPTGVAAASDDTSYLEGKRDSEARLTRLGSLRQRIEVLNRERSNYLREINSADGTLQSRRAELDRQIESVGLKITGFDVENKRHQLTKIERENSNLRILIDETTRREDVGATIAPPQSQSVSHSIDPFAPLYQRLDEIDNQIRRWRRVQMDIQSQRVRLKDEMVVWTDLTLESDEHPYHNAREILVALENKVDATERLTHQWSGNTKQRDPNLLARPIQDICKTMRDDLYGLCQELAQQYKHIRHKAAAAELKQLRRCYHEMGENTDRLVRRRETVINEIRAIDPAGADAIVRSETGFCQCAMHEGYLAARRRYVGVAPTRVATTPVIVRTDLTEPLRRLESLEVQRQDLQRWLANADTELLSLKSRHAQLISDRERLRSEQDQGRLHAELKRVDDELRTYGPEIDQLTKLIEEDRSHVPSKPNPILARAATLLNRVTHGELLQVWLADSRHEVDFQVRNRQGRVLSFSSLESAEQDQIYLCLAFAAKEALNGPANGLPILIDDAFANITHERVNATLELLTELAVAGHQIIVLTQHRYLADRVPGSPVFELPPATGFTEPAALPGRSAPLPAVATPPRREPSYQLPLATPAYDYDAYSSFDSTRTYPYTKYPDIHDVTEYRDQSNYILPYPNPAAYHDATYALPANQSFVARNVTPVPVEAIGDQLGFVPAYDDYTALDQLGLFESTQLRTLSDTGVNTLGQLLALDPEQLPGSLRDNGVSMDRLNRWQSYVWLLSNIPGLRNSDARILVACGITEPEHLATSHGQQLFERIQRFISSSEGQRFASQTPTISLDRINGWNRALSSTHTRWQRGRGLERQSRQVTSARNTSSSRSAGTGSHSDRNGRSFDRPVVAASAGNETQVPNFRNGQSTSREYSTRSTQRDFRREDRPRSEQEPRREREPRTHEPFVARDPRIRMPDPREAHEPRTSSTRPNNERPTAASLSNTRSSVPSIPPVGRTRTSSDREPSKNGSDKNRFYLELKDHIEAAPSIGPKTAERFEKIGVHTVEDFLKQTAESMSAKLKYKRITADVVRAWQHQARLVCRIPNLRGHDAQLLVACDFTEPETIATMQPRQLFDVIGPFSESKDGQKIIRTGKNPDLAEITDWIAWAAQTRSLQAA